MNRFGLSCAWDATITGEITSLDISPDGGFCAAGTSTGVVSFFAVDGRELWQADCEFPIRDLCCSEGGEFVATLTERLDLMVFDRGGNLRWESLLKFEAGCLDLRPGSNLIVIGNRFGLFRYVTIHGKRVGGGETSHPT